MGSLFSAHEWNRYSHKIKQPNILQTRNFDDVSKRVEKLSLFPSTANIEHLRDRLGLLKKKVFFKMGNTRSGAILATREKVFVPTYFSHGFVLYKHNI